MTIWKATDEQVRGMQEHFRYQGFCGNLIYEGTRICILEADHEEPCEKTESSQEQDGRLL